eukprot:1665717-Pleurochrysis_carterae.AAC.2
MVLEQPSYSIGAARRRLRDYDRVYKQHLHTRVPARTARHEHRLRSAVLLGVVAVAPGGQRGRQRRRPRRCARGGQRQPRAAQFVFKWRERRAYRRARGRAALSRGADRSRSLAQSADGGGRVRGRGRAARIRAGAQHVRRAETTRLRGSWPGATG